MVSKLWSELKEVRSTRFLWQADRVMVSYMKSRCVCEGVWNDENAMKSYRNVVVISKDYQMCKSMCGTSLELYWHNRCYQLVQYRIVIPSFVYVISIEP